MQTYALFNEIIFIGLQLNLNIWLCLNELGFVKKKMTAASFLLHQTLYVCNATYAYLTALLTFIIFLFHIRSFSS